ncbi:MAG TPA: ornithine cyclodeaminase family protein [Halobacteriales archaeon]|jgi:alanine dehydrogenase|nr:ornithine cyclodeaminase family protein [Halobacteriales archaeon]
MIDTILYLTTEDLIDLADPEDYVNATRDAYRERGHGAPSNAPSALATEDPNTDLTGYMSMLPEMGYMGYYVYSVGGPERDGWFTCPLWDIKTGKMLAILDGSYWNPLKTGASSAVASEVLARDDSESVGIIGTSRVSYGALQTLAVVRDITSVKVYSRKSDNREAFCKTIEKDMGFDAKPVDSSDGAVDDVDILVTATVASDPVFDGSRLSPGIHVNAMGQSGHERELDIEAICKADKYVPDLRERVFAHGVQERLRMAGGFLAAYNAGRVGENHIYAEIGDIISGRIPGRTSAEEITIFDSTGVGVETVASAAMLYEKAIKEGLGIELPMTSYKNATPGTGKI